MRRRRSRLPLIALAGLALLLGAGLAFAVSDPRILGQLQAGGPGSTTLGIALGTGPTASVAGLSGPAGASADPSPAGAAPSGASPSGSPGATAPSGSPAPSQSSSSAPSSAPGSPTASGAVTPARVVFSGSRAKKVIALTFDDGSNPVALRRILAILKREKVAATFFPYGWAVHADPAGWHAVVAAGYPIANHTLSHSVLTTLTPAQVTEEMVHGRRTIDLYSGGTSIDLMRPPAGLYTTATRLAVAQGGYPTMVLWDVDTFDWKGVSVKTIKARAIRGTNGSIVLMHAGPLNTPKALPAIIASYRARGFTFVTLPQLLGTG